MTSKVRSVDAMEKAEGARIISVDDRATVRRGGYLFFSSITRSHRNLPRGSRGKFQTNGQIFGSQLIDYARFDRSVKETTEPSAWSFLFGFASQTVFSCSSWVHCQVRGGFPEPRLPTDSSV